MEEESSRWTGKGGEMEKARGLPKRWKGMKQNGRQWEKEKNVET